MNSVKTAKIFAFPSKAVKQLQDEGKPLATLHGNDFCLPLLIAAKNDNTELINLLVENGACLFTARRDPRFQYLNARMQSYLTSLMHFSQHILDSI